MTRLARPLAFAALVALVALPPLVAPRPAHADDTGERKGRAYALIAEGKTRFDLGKFDEAIDLFQKAYEVYPYPEALYSMAQAYRMKKDYERAVFFYKSYLRNAAESAPNRESVEARVQEMEQLIAAQKASAIKPPQGVEAPAAPDGVVPPAGAETSPPPAGAEAHPAPAATEPTPAPWYHDGWGWTLAAGGALAATGGVLLVVDGSRDCRAGDQLCADDEQNAQGERVLGYSLAGAGAVALVWGVVKLALTDAPAPAGRDVALVVGARYLGLAGRF